MTTQDIKAIKVLSIIATLAVLWETAQNSLSSVVDFTPSVQLLHRLPINHGVLCTAASCTVQMFHSFLINYCFPHSRYVHWDITGPITHYCLSRRVRRSIQRRLQPAMYVWIEYARLSCKRERQGARSSVNCSQFSVFMLSAFKSLFSTSL